MIWAALALAGQMPALLPAADPACRHDRAAMLALDEDAFDQDLTGGWRALSNKGCELAAADLIAAYRASHGGGRGVLSLWHEGQLRADAGQTARAIALFARSRKTRAEDAGWGWNLYVDGSLAFLRHDRPALRVARDRVAALPPPADLARARGPDGKPATIRWPMNLNILDGLLRCFDRLYRIAYGDGACSTPMRKVTAPSR